MAKCYICHKELTPNNSSVEHIIPNAIGGHLKSKKLLCKECNSNFGNDIDTALTQQFAWIATILNIPRDRGINVPFSMESESGEKYTIGADGIPRPLIPSKKEENGKIIIRAKDKKQAKKQIKGLAKKYPNIDIQTAIAGLQENKFYSEEKLGMDLQFGGQEMYRSLCKTVVSFYLYKGHPLGYVDNVITYVKNGNNQCQKKSQEEIIFPPYIILKYL